MTLLHGFELLREQSIPELNTHARIFRHARTGAELISLENDDENKCFTISFRTPPTDSTGVAHILEHSVLCGSRKYPLKEPFITMVGGSLQTFLNAFTYPDRTAYPLASQNLQDFYNLIDVYLDAVLHPTLTQHSFAQEGWHYEPDESQSELIYRGVVYNEMKGVYGSPDEVLQQHVQSSLFPDTLYGLDSGGDPREIPNLTYEQLLSFHRTYYHPSNAHIYFYGDDPADERLRILDSWLQAFEPQAVNSTIPLQPPFAKPHTIEQPYPAGEAATDAAQHYVTVNWVVGAKGDVETELSLSILAEILLGTPGSPLRNALLESGLGEDLAGLGLESDLRQIIFSTGLKGVTPENVAAVESLVLATLGELAETGIDAGAIEAAVNTVEFDLRENNTGSFPRGLAVILRSLGSANYDADPLAPLAFEAPLAAIKAQLAAGKRYFEQFIRARFLTNPHRSTVILRPDSELQTHSAAAEAERLAAAQATMTPAALDEIAAFADELQALQETPDPPDALALLPMLHLADIDRENKVLPIDVLAHGPTPILYHDLFTNGIVYLDLGFDLYTLPAEDLPLVELFGRALLEMGTEREDFVALSQRIGSKTGGIHAMTFTTAHRQDGDPSALFILRGKATLAHSADLVDILRDVLLEARFDDRARFRQMLLEEKAQLESELLPSGHRVVRSRLHAHFDEAAWAAEEMGGVSRLFFLRELANQVETDWPGVLARLAGIRGRLLSRGAVLANVTVDEAGWRDFYPQLAGLIDSLPVNTARRQRWPVGALARHEGLAVPSEVNYVGKGVRLYDHGYRAHGSAHVAVNLLGTGYLWERVRMQGGAYGAFCTFDTRSGIFGFGSYRDPNVATTLAAYDAAADYLRRVELDDDALHRAIIGVIGQIDAPLFPDAKGFVAMQRHLAGESVALRQQMREEVLGTSLADLRGFAAALDAVRDSGDVVVLGSAADMFEFNAGRAQPLVVTPVL